LRCRLENKMLQMLPDQGYSDLVANQFLKTNFEVTFNEMCPAETPDANDSQAQYIHDDMLSPAEPPPHNLNPMEQESLGHRSMIALVCRKDKWRLTLNAASSLRRTSVQINRISHNNGESITMTLVDNMGLTYRIDLDKLCILPDEIAQGTSQRLQYLILQRGRNV
jgi:hypothetical protein